MLKSEPLYSQTKEKEIKSQTKEKEEKYNHLKNKKGSTFYNSDKKILV